MIRLTPRNSSFKSWTCGHHWRERVLTFNVNWYVLTMGTGVVVQVLHNFPYQSFWLHNLAFCFWILNIAIFSFFTLLSTARAFLFPRLSMALLLDFSQTSYFGAIPITIDTILEGLVIFYPTRTAAIWAAFALFWIAVIMSLIVGFGLLVVSAHQEPQGLESVTAVWLLSFIPFIVTGGVGGSLAPLLPTTGTATLCLTLSFMSWSIGIILTHLILAIYLYRLTACSLPPRAAIVSCFIPIGPTGMGSYAIQLLSKALTSLLDRTKLTFRAPAIQYNSASLDPTSGRAVAETLHWIGVMLGLLLVAEATFWLLFAVGALLWRPPRGFNVGTWAIVFPCGVYANALCMLGVNFRNEAWKGYAAALCVFTVLAWCTCAALTVYKGIWKAELFIAPGLEGWHEKMALEKLREGYAHRGQAERGNDHSEKSDLESGHSFQIKHEDRGVSNVSDEDSGGRYSRKS